MSYRKLLSRTLLVFVSTVSTLSFAQDVNGLVFLVRHAEKISEAKDALLSPQGRKRAQCLANMLEAAGIREILVTQVVRTQQTAEPLAKKSGITPTILKADDIAAFVNKLQAAKDENVLVVGHADTIPDIIEKLGGGKVSLENSDYDKVFVFRWNANGNKGSVTSLHYCDCK